MKNFETRIFKSKKADWYVYIYDTTNQKIIKKFYKGINDSEDDEEKLLKCWELKSVVEEELKNGWIPNKVSLKQSLSIAQAVMFALEKKKESVSNGTFRNYRCMANFFVETSKILDIEDLPIEACERFHVKSIMDKLQTDKGWTNKNFNKNLGFLKSLFSELVEWEYIKTNFCKDIRSKKEIKTEGYVLPLDNEKKIIFDHLKEVDYNFYIFCCIEYYLGIRPKEILLLKCGDVDLENKVIKILPENSKDASYRYVPILKPVMELLLKMDLSQKDYYLIGRPKAYGCRFFKHEYFCPNPYPIKRDTATRRWKELVIDGLGINVKCYALKHSGANAKLIAGMDLKTISEIFGHSDEKMTEIYANYINQKRFKEAQNIELEEY